MHKLIGRLSRGMAYAGGAVLTALIVLTCLSVLGRVLNGALHSDLVQGVAPGPAKWLLGLGIGPINGDFELVQAGMAFAIFAFLPLCQLAGGHASVDVFTRGLPPRAQRLLRAAIEVVFAGVLVLIAWQLMQGMFSKMRTGQTTFLLQFPLWWAYAASLVGASVAALVGAYLAVLACLEAWTGRPVLPQGSGLQP